MVNTLRKIEEKGQRTPRSLDVYQDKGGVKGASYCDCGAVYVNKRWRNGTDTDIPEGENMLICPACRRIADQNPAGIVSLRGEFFEEHQGEIDNLINNTVQAVMVRNPLGRIMNTSIENGMVTITTTDAKLAEKLGRDIFKAYAGELQINWGQADNPVRVDWSR